MQKYNLVHNVKDITDQSGTPDEPVTVSEAKAYMRLEGWQDVSESDSTEFDDDDTLIERYITSARKKLEKLYGISIIPKTLKATITNLAGDIEIPQGPVISITDVKDSCGSEITDYTLVGYPEQEEEYNDFLHLQWPNYSKMVVTYEAGYSECPEELKDEILRIVAYWYTERGDQELKGFNFQTGHFNRRSWLV